MDELIVLDEGVSSNLLIAVGKRKKSQRTERVEEE